MSETVALALINAVVSIVASISAAMVVWRKARGVVSDRTKQKVEEVYGIVNSHCEAMLAKIADLEARLIQDQYPDRLPENRGEGDST